MNSFVFTLFRNESENFEWENPESTVIQAVDLDMAIREFMNRYLFDINEIGHVEEGKVVYLNSVDGWELVFKIIKLNDNELDSKDAV